MDFHMVQFFLEDPAEAGRCCIHWGGYVRRVNQLPLTFLDKKIGYPNVIQRVKKVSKGNPVVESVGIQRNVIQSSIQR